MLRSASIAYLLSVGLFVVLAETAYGQSPLGNRRTVRPWDQISSRPTVSPYLNLIMGNSTASGLPAYHTQVRPQLEARDRNRQQARQISGMQQQISRVQNDVTRMGNTGGLRTTGHPTRFMNYLHYYPQLRR